MGRDRIGRTTWVGLLVLALMGPGWAADPSQQASAGNTEFALALYGKLARKPGNLAFSPFSISTALSMVGAATRGETAHEVASVLHLPETAPHQAMGSLLRKLLEPQQGIKLSLAQRSWPSKSLALNPDYVKLLKQDYQSDLQSLDYRQPEKARTQINHWVADKTGGKIPELLPRGMVDSGVMLVLTQAIYFEGSWAESCPRAATREARFYGSTGGTSACMMMQREASLRWNEVDGVQILELPYLGGRFSMVVLLPEEVSGLPALERQLDAPHWQQWLSGLRESTVMVGLPRFRVEGDLSLPPTLRGMGMRSLFGSGCNLSGLTEDSSGLFVSDCVHKAVVDVNEEGTVATAATAVIMTRSLPVQFTANHSFVFAIRDRETDSILFLGRVEKP